MARPTTTELLKYFLYLGSLGFGGPSRSSVTCSGISSSSVVLARRAIVDVPTLVIAAAALVVAWRFKVPEPLLIAAGAAVGLVIFSLR